MTKIEAITDLKEHDHAILTPEYASGIAGHFGVQPPVRLFSVGTGRVVNGPEGEWKGVAAHELAETIADSLGLEYPSQLGIGSRLRVACDAVIGYLA